jgi:hypothetical protein
MSKDSLTCTLEKWERMLSAAKANRMDLPFQVAVRTRLAADLEHAKALRHRREALRGEMLQSTQELKALLARGRTLASRIKVCALAQLGPESRKLGEFGIRPRRKRLPRVCSRPKDEAPRNPTTA